MFHIRLELAGLHGNRCRLAGAVKVRRWFVPKNMAEKRKKAYNFHSEWEEEEGGRFLRVSLLRGDCGVERHFRMCHTSYHANYPPDSALRAEKARELKAGLSKQQSFFTRPVKNSQKATKASFRAMHFLIKKKKAFSDGEVFKEAMMIRNRWKGTAGKAGFSDYRWGSCYDRPTYRIHRSL